jgi:hypothetical protein
MPQQETFFERVSGDRRIEVLKTYDATYAREVFGTMDPTAQEYLWNSLRIADNYEPEDLPPLDTPECDDFLWQELLDAAREDGNLLSFFVVNQVKQTLSRSLFVSPDWPSAEAFALNQLQGVGR